MPSGDNLYYDKSPYGTAPYILGKEKKVLYEGRTRPRDKAAKSRKALLETRTSTQNRCKSRTETILLPQNCVFFKLSDELRVSCYSAKG